jgi:autotransporter-associated beta strand protein
VANTYTGLTTVSAGTLSLSKGAGVAAIAGNVTINGGAAREDLTNQIAATSNVLVISGGIFDVNNLAATIGPLRVSGGSVTIGTGMLTVGSLTMSGGGIASTGTGTLALQGDVTTNTAGFAATISGNLDLGGATHTFDVAEGLPTIDLDISAVITNGGFTKSGGGTLHLSGSGNNTYTGLTTVSAGTLELAKSGGFAFAMGGNLTINNAVVRALADREIGTATTVTVNGGGTFDFNNFDDFMGPLTVNGGSVTIGTGLVEAHLVTMTGGSITSTGTGELDLLDNLTTNQSPVPATISGRLQLQSVLRTFTIADGPAVPDLDISAVVDDFGSNGGLNKTGAGSLLFSGSQANTQTSTTVSAGTLELAKTGGAVAVPVVLTINGGAVRESAGNQIADTCAVNVTTAGTLDLNGQIDTIGPLTLMSGIVTIGTGTLTAGSLTMTGGGIGSTGAGTLVLQGDVTTNIAPAPATISGNLDLGGKTCDFTVNDGAAVPDLDISAVISNGGMFKSGNGTLRLSGAQANTYTGQTSVSGGTLELGKTGGSLAVMGTLGISSGGTVRELGDNQIVDTSGVSVVSSSTQFDLNGFTDAVASLFVAGAGVTIRTGTLMPGTLLMDGGTIQYAATSTNGSTVTLAEGLMAGEKIAANVPDEVKNGSRVQPVSGGEMGK